MDYRGGGADYFGTAVDWCVYEGEKMKYVIQTTLIFDDTDLEEAKKWWKKNKYSHENDESILLSAALNGVVNPDIDEVEMFDENDEDSDDEDSEDE